jgi:hypothetical protein
VSRAAYLRIYVPVGGFEGDLEHAGSEALSSAGVLTRGEFGVWYESARDDAFMIKHKGAEYVCPRYPRLRMLEGLIAFRNAYPGAIGRLLVPEGVADRAAMELDAIQDRSPGARSHILTSPFFVPLRWFAAFNAAERELVEGPNGLSIRYRTRLAAAVARLERTVGVLDDVGFDDVIVDQVREVAAWMMPFPEEGLLELDYGGVAGLFSDGDLALDDSGAEVTASIDALEEGDLEMAGERYAEAASRWAHAQSLSYAN